MIVSMVYLLARRLVELSVSAPAAVDDVACDSFHAFWSLLLWVPDRSSTSCDVGVFVDQSTELVAASDV